jgi:hypothetical protein
VRVVRSLVIRVLSVLAIAGLVSAAGVSASTEAWRLVKKGPTVGAGEIAFVGDIVRRPTTVAFRAVGSKPETITLTVTMSCRQGLKTRVGRQRLSGRATYTKAVRLPLAGADHCAVSATGTSAAGSLRLELLRGA